MSDASMEQNWCKWPEHDWKRFVEVSNKLIAAERVETERLKAWLTLMDAARDLLAQVEISAPREFRSNVEPERKKLRAAIDTLQPLPLQHLRG